MLLCRFRGLLFDMGSSFDLRLTLHLELRIETYRAAVKLVANQLAEHHVWLGDHPDEFRHQGALL
jgi:hypothetical protein